RRLLGRRLRDRGLRRRRLLLGRRGSVRGAVRTGKDAVEPLGRGLFVHVLRVHQLAREDLLGLDEHLLLARREALFTVADRQGPDDLGELEDVARLHLVAVVLEAAGAVFFLLRVAPGGGGVGGAVHFLAPRLP